ncbi:XRE family transcriptional regulator [Modicisalibacter sp. 'Wilcox']|uniref:helix-turn-helix domain-containing protein n=1 Tax=Modicisalibacter sp. 'Wilcox' TaxID=2679914 RepID=UPI0013D1CE5B|nr:XRE family transcriptional regulator [Modicisalibacter sp. 'Wilcox']
MPDPTQHIAVTLKALRQARGWSLARTAEATGVSKAMLGQIERGESSPTVATLWKIAGGLEGSFSAFLAEPAAAPSAEPQAVLSDSAGMHMRVLIPFDPRWRLEMFAIDLEPGACSESSPHGVGVVEHVIVIEGALEVAEAGRWQTASAGDVLQLDAAQTHAYRNPHEARARFHNLVHYPAGE